MIPTGFLQDLAEQFLPETATISRATETVTSGGVTQTWAAVATVAAAVVRRALQAARNAVGVGGEVDGERAAGGPVRAGGLYLVGERGPELFAPTTAGRIVPNHRLTASPELVAAGGRGSGSSVVVHVHGSLIHQSDLQRVITEAVGGGLRSGSRLI